MFTVIPYDMNCKSWKSILCTCYVKHISIANNFPPNSVNVNRRYELKQNKLIN